MFERKLSQVAAELLNDVCFATARGASFVTSEADRLILGRLRARQLVFKSTVNSWRATRAGFRVAQMDPETGEPTLSQENGR